MLSMNDIRIDEEVFTAIDDATGKQTTWAVERLFTYAQAHVKPSPIVVDEEHAIYCMENRGVEEDRLFALQPEDFKKPLLFVQHPDESVVLVDGTHRYVLAFAIGIKKLLAYMVPASEAEAFVIDVPEVDPDRLLNSASLLKLFRRDRKK